MRTEAEKALEERLQNAARVLDVGGAREIAVHATHVMDILTYEQAKAKWGLYCKDTQIPTENWTVHDICSSDGFPFPDNYFDFAICSHVLEDVRDPVFVCKEISRVAKSGYIETPSPFVELTRGVDNGVKDWVGYWHHRWLVSWEDNRLIFVLKPHFLLSSKRFHFPRRYLSKWRRENKLYTRLLWEDSVIGHERMIFPLHELEEYIERIIALERGDLFQMKIARLRRRMWSLGKNWAIRLGIDDRLRSIILRFPKLF